MNDELRLTSDTVCVMEKALDCTEELPLERDIVLPDYYPDVFRILRCTAEPRLASQSISGGRLTFDVTVTVRVLYLTEGSRRINCIEQNAEISRTIDVEGECDSPEVMIDLACRGVSCRARLYMAEIAAVYGLFFRFIKDVSAEFQARLESG